MLTRLIKMPKIAAKSGEFIDTTTSPVDKMNLDRSPPIHCPFFVRGSWFPSFLVWKTKTHNRFLNDAFR